MKLPDLKATRRQPLLSLCPALTRRQAASQRPALQLVLVRMLVRMLVLVLGLGLQCESALAAVPGGAPPVPTPAPTVAPSPVPAAALRIVGGLATLNQYTRHEAPFWTQTLPALTGGRVQAEIVPFDRAGIRGQDMLRLMQHGVVPFGTAQLILAGTEDAMIMAPDLPGLNPDMASLRRSVAAFRPALATRLRQRHGLELLAVYAYPAQVLFCKRAFSGLADLRGRRIRVSGVAIADLVEALGATPLLLPFVDIVPQARADAIDCAITGAMSGNTIGLHQVTSHQHTLAISWGLSVFAANRAAWAALSPELRALLQQQLPLLEQSIWAEAERETGEGLACNTGAEPCRSGQRGHMTSVLPSGADRARLQELLARTTLPRWLQRCGAGCAEIWNVTLAPVSGVTAKP